MYQDAIAERRRSEADLGLLENRIRHLEVVELRAVAVWAPASAWLCAQAEDAKAQRRIAETNDRIEQVCALKQRNETKKLRQFKVST